VEWPGTRPAIPLVIVSVYRSQINRTTIRIKTKVPIPMYIPMPPLLRARNVLVPFPGTSLREPDRGGLATQNIGGRRGERASPSSNRARGGGFERFRDPG
jgi:hypothetical protein